MKLFLQETQLNSDVTDELRAKKYWEICENLVQLKIEDPHIMKSEDYLHSFLK